jgi:hypothetical protein
MDKVYPTKTLMIFHALEMSTNPFRLKEGEEGLGLKYPYQVSLD